MTDIPAERRKCYGLRPGAPCPSYEDGTWPEGCECYMLGAGYTMRNYSGSLTWATLGIIFVILSLIMFAIGLIATAAYGGEIKCLSKEEARAKYPNQVIYWRTANRCWGIEKPVATPTRYSKGDRLDIGTPIDASGNPVSPARRVEKPITLGPSVYYPELMGGGGTTRDMLTPHSMQWWPVVTDIDTDPPAFLPWSRVTK